MVLIVRSKLESIGADGHVASLQEGDVCGEELITWYLAQHSSGHYKEGGKGRFQGLRLFSARTVRCLTNVEAFALRADDLEHAERGKGYLDIIQHDWAHPKMST